MMNKDCIFYWLYYACKLNTSACMFCLTFINLKLFLLLLFHRTVTQIREQEELTCPLHPSTSSLGRVVFTKHTTWRTENLAGSWPSRTGSGHPYLMLAEFATGPSNTNRSGLGVTGDRLEVLAAATAQRGFTAATQSSRFITDRRRSTLLWLRFQWEWKRLALDACTISDICLLGWVYSD